MEVIDRIIEIQQEEHLHSQRAFELSIGKTSGYLNMTKKRNSIPGIDIINKIIEIYPKYSLYWLVTGKGQKYADSKQLDVLNEEQADYNKIKTTDYLSLSQRIDVVINQNNEILDKLNRGIAKDLLEAEKNKLGNTSKTNNH